MFSDTHTHSIYSFDGHAQPEEMCEAAIRAGVPAFAVTDHYDIDGILAGYYPPFDAAGVRRALERAREKYAGRVRLVRGIELGQAWLYPDEARAFLCEQRFEFVIGSCHNLEGVPDFSFLNYTHMPDALISQLFSRMIAALTKCAAFPGVSVIAHPLYPLRYILRCGRDLPLESFEEPFRELFSVMRENGAALEMNLRGILMGYTDAETEGWIMRLWRDAGGRGVTLASDAHRPEDIGAGQDIGAQILRDAGFTRVVFPGVDGPTHEDL